MPSFAAVVTGTASTATDTRYLLIDTVSRLYVSFYRIGLEREWAYHVSLFTAIVTQHTASSIAATFSLDLLIWTLSGLLVSEIKCEKG